MEKVLFLDLEETVIRSWDNPLFCNTDFILDVLKKENVKQVHIYSFAIYNDHDKEIFEKTMKAGLEQHLGVEILSWMSIKELMKKVFFYNGVVFDQNEFITVWGKVRSFHDFCSGEFSNMECILVDDVVPNSRFELPDKNLVIRTIKVPFKSH